MRAAGTGRGEGDIVAIGTPARIFIVACALGDSPQLGSVDLDCEDIEIAISRDKSQPLTVWRPGGIRVVVPLEGDPVVTVEGRGTTRR